MTELERWLRCVEHYTGRMSPFALNFIFNVLSTDIPLSQAVRLTQEEILGKVREAYPCYPKEIADGEWKVPVYRWKWVLSEEYLVGNGLR